MELEKSRVYITYNWAKKPGEHFGIEHNTTATYYCYYLLLQPATTIYI